MTPDRDHQVGKAVEEAAARWLFLRLMRERKIADPSWLGLTDKQREGWIEDARSFLAAIQPCLVQREEAKPASEEAVAFDEEAHPRNVFIECVDGYLRVMPPGDWVDFEGRVHYVPASTPTQQGDEQKGGVGQEAQANLRACATNVVAAWDNPSPGPEKWSRLRQKIDYLREAL